MLAARCDQFFLAWPFIILYVHGKSIGLRRLYQKAYSVDAGLSLRPLHYSTEKLLGLG
jgi:hypothetical protein